MKSPSEATENWPSSVLGRNFQIFTFLAGCSELYASVSTKETPLQEIYGTLNYPVGPKSAQF